MGRADVAQRFHPIGARRTKALGGRYQRDPPIAIGASERVSYPLPPCPAPPLDRIEQPANDPGK
jgi:hypothetical protein